jgi:hypothetical protein
MTWYAATIISVVRVRSGKQKTFPVWEDVCLIEAASDEDAFEKAESLGKSREVDDQTTMLDGVCRECRLSWSAEGWENHKSVSRAPR